MITKMVNFSGGIDSTLVLIDLLKTSEIIVHHVVLKNNLNRWEQELSAVKSILKVLKETYNYKFQYVETVIDVSGHKMTYDSLYTTQAAAVYCFSRNISEVYMGFIKEDALPSFDYQKVLSAPFDKKISPRVITPLRNTPKEEVIKRLKKYPDIFKLCFWCRFPKGNTPCGGCSSCILYKKAS